MNTLGEKVTREPNRESRREEASASSSSRDAERRNSCDGRWYDM
jgi:hypothetical protein